MPRSLQVLVALGALVAPLALAQPLVYVTSPGANSLTAINSGNNTITRVVSGLTSARALAISPDGTRIYVAASGNGENGEVAALDGTKIADPNQNPLIAEVRVGGKPIAVAYDGRTGLLYVADAKNNQAASYDLTSINPEDPKKIATYPAGDGLSAMALAPDGKTLALASSAAPEVSLYDLRVVAAGLDGRTTVDLSAKPRALAFSANGEMLWIATDAGISGYSLASGKANSKALAGGTTSIAIAPRAKRVYFGAGSGHTVYAYDPASGNVSNITVPGPVAGLSLSADGTRLYAALDCDDCGAAVIATSDGRLLKQVHFGSGSETAGRFAGPGAIYAPDATTVGAIGEQLSGRVEASDYRSRSLSYHLIQSPPAGTISFAESGDFTYTPPSGYSGIERFVWQATAASGEGAPVNPASRPITETLEFPPRVSAIDNQSAPPGSTVGPLPFTLTGSKPFTLYVDSSESGLADPDKITVNEGCGTTTLACSLTVPLEDIANGKTEITLTAVGSGGLTTSTQFKIIVGNGSNECDCGGLGLAGLGELAFLVLIGVVWRRRKNNGRI